MKKIEMKEMDIAPHFLNIEPVPFHNNLYKAVVVDGSVRALQVFPFLISKEDSQRLQQEIMVLNEAIEGYGAAIPKIFSNGFTETESYPFIEMEWIDGNSVDEILQASHAPVFTIEETILLAEQVSVSLAHLHFLGLRHGNINKSNIKWDYRKKHYFLLNFDFQLKHSTPKKVYLQKPKPLIADSEESTTMPETDVQAVGLLLFQLLTGCNDVPSVMDIVSLRTNALPKNWSQEKQNEEKKIPEWLLRIITGCLKGGVFENASVLYHSILFNHKKPLRKKEWYRSTPQQDVQSRPVLKKVLKQATILKTRISGIRKPSREKQHVWLNRFFIGVIIITAIFTGFSFQALEKEKAANKKMISFVNNPEDSIKVDEANTDKKELPKKQDAVLIKVENGKPANAKPVAAEVKINTALKKQKDRSPLKGAVSLGKYKVRSKAYFYTNPDEGTKRHAFIVHWNNAVLKPVQETNDFIYIEFLNTQGQTSKGWIRKIDLVKIKN